MLSRILLVLAICLVIINAPVSAADYAQVPEGSSVTLFALGLAGVIIGRRIAMRKNADKGSDKDE